MAGNLQPLDQKFPVVKPDGTPTDYFIRWAQQRQVDIGTAITEQDLLDYLVAHKLQAGSGIGLTPSGNLSDSPTIAAKVQEILDQISATQGTVLYRGAAGWAALAPGTSGAFLKTNGAGADPAWAAAGGGTHVSRAGAAVWRMDATATFGANFWGGIAFTPTFDFTSDGMFVQVTTAAPTAQMTPASYLWAPTNTLGALVASGPAVTGATVGENFLPFTSIATFNVGSLYLIGLQIKVAGVTFQSPIGTIDKAIAAAGGLPAPGSGFGGGGTDQWGSFQLHVL